MTKFKKYFAKNKIAPSRLAKMAGLEVNTISRWLAGKNKPHEQKAQILVDYVNNAFSVNDIYQHILNVRKREASLHTPMKWRSDTQGLQ